jgi:phosphate transport system permease protein
VDRVFGVVCAGVAALAVALLAVLIVSIASSGLRYLDFEFLTSRAHYRPDEAGIRDSVMGTVWVCLICGITGLPLGVAAAVYLHEFARRGKVASFIQLNIANLAGVPSVVYGLIGLSAFAYFGGLLGDARFRIGVAGTPFQLEVPFGRTVLTGGLTLMLVVLPVVIIATQEALRAVPDSLRQGALALGATRWQMVRRMTLPCAMPGIMTGAILAMSRAIGEAAPILVAGAVLEASSPTSLASRYTAMPVQIYHWTGHTNPEFHRVAAAAIIVLLGVLLTFNAVAILIRARYSRPVSV